MKRLDAPKLISTVLDLKTKSIFLSFFKKTSMGLLQFIRAFQFHQ